MEIVRTSTGWAMILTLGQGKRVQSASFDHIVDAISWGYKARRIYAKDTHR